MCSINDRLGGGKGADIPPLTDAWLEDLCYLAQADVEDNDDESPGDFDEDDFE